MKWIFTFIACCIAGSTMFSQEAYAKNKFRLNSVQHFSVASSSPVQQSAAPQQLEAAPPQIQSSITINAPGPAPYRGDTAVKESACQCGPNCNCGPDCSCKIARVAASKQSSNSLQGYSVVKSTVRIHNRR